MRPGWVAVHEKQNTRNRGRVGRLAGALCPARRRGARLRRLFRLIPTRKPNDKRHTQTAKGRANGDSSIPGGASVGEGRS